MPVAYGMTYPIAMGSMPTGLCLSNLVHPRVPLARHRPNDYSQVCGQFNKGFMIAELDGDLFIIDQHASDEKARFEALQESTTIRTQPLIRPLPLECSAAEEQTIVDHKDIFDANGAALPT